MTGAERRVQEQARNVGDSAIVDGSSSRDKPRIVARNRNEDWEDPFWPSLLVGASPSVHRFRARLGQSGAIFGSTAAFNTDLQFD